MLVRSLCNEEQKQCVAHDVILYASATHSAPPRLPSSPPRMNVLPECFSCHTIVKSESERVQGAGVGVYVVVGGGGEVGG